MNGPKFAIAFDDHKRSLYYRYSINFGGFIVRSRAVDQGNYRCTLGIKVTDKARD